jgi:hypothetical protein
VTTSRLVPFVPRQLREGHPVVPLLRAIGWHEAPRATSPGESILLAWARPPALASGVLSL